MIEPITKPQGGLPVLFTVPMAARTLGISPDSIRGAIARGELKAVRVTEHGWPRVASTELNRWIDSLTSSSSS